MEIKINPELNAKGLYSTKSYLKDEIVFTLAGKLYDYPTRETIYIGDNKHIYDDREAKANLEEQKKEDRTSETLIKKKTYKIIWK